MQCTSNDKFFVQCRMGRWHWLPCKRTFLHEDHVIAFGSHLNSAASNASTLGKNPAKRTYILFTMTSGEYTFSIAHRSLGTRQGISASLHAFSQKLSRPSFWGSPVAHIFSDLSILPFVCIVDCTTRHLIRPTRKSC